MIFILIFFFPLCGSVFDSLIFSLTLPKCLQVATEMSRHLALAATLA